MADKYPDRQPPSPFDNPAGNRPRNPAPRPVTSDPMKPPKPTQGVTPLPAPAAVPPFTGPPAREPMMTPTPTTGAPQQTIGGVPLRPWGGTH